MRDAYLRVLFGYVQLACRLCNNIYITLLSGNFSYLFKSTNIHTCYVYQDVYSFALVHSILCRMQVHALTRKYEQKFSNPLQRALFYTTDRSTTDRQLYKSQRSSRHNNLLNCIHHQLTIRPLITD